MDGVVDMDDCKVKSTEEAEEFECPKINPKKTIMCSRDCQCSRQWTINHCHHSSIYKSWRWTFQAIQTSMKTQGFPVTSKQKKYVLRTLLPGQRGAVACLAAHPMGTHIACGGESRKGFNYLQH